LCFSGFKIADRRSTTIVIKENPIGAIAQLRIEILLSNSDSLKPAAIISIWADTGLIINWRLQNSRTQNLRLL
jgi:hypothetical protein